MELKPGKLYKRDILKDRPLLLYPERNTKRRTKNGEILLFVGKYSSVDSESSWSIVGNLFVDQNGFPCYISCYHIECLKEARN